jgi:arylsulfatase A-like enzyme
MDELFGGIIKELEVRGRLDNTLIIFTSDNGMMLGQHGKCGKNSMFEDSIRTPLVVWYGDALPKPQAPREIQDMSLNIDIAPTILDYAGVKIPAAMQGISLRPVIETHAQTRDMFYYEHMLKGVPPQCSGVRSEAWKYSRYTGRDGREFELLYHIGEDPLEQHDMSKNADAAAVLNSMRERCERYKKEVV